MKNHPFHNDIGTLFQGLNMYFPKVLLILNYLLLATNLINFIYVTVTDINYE